MLRIILILSLFFVIDCSYLGTDCHLNETQPDLTFDECLTIETSDWTSSCPIFVPSLCQSNPCFCDPSNSTLPISYPCPERYVCKWVKKSDPPSQNLSESAKIWIGVCVTVLILGIAVCIACYRWKRVCVQILTSSNHRFYATFHSNSDNAIIHCDSNV